MAKSVSAHPSKDPVARSYVALLRGVNVGRAKRIAMGDLRKLLTDLGLHDVRTLLQSGNAIFTSAGTPEDLAARIESAIAEQFHLETRCLVRPGADMSRALARNPWPDKASEGSKLLVLFLSASPGSHLAAEQDPTRLDPDGIHIDDTVVYQWCPEGLLAAAPVSTFIEKHWDVSVTGRNLNTVSKLAAMVGDQP